MTFYAMAGVTARFGHPIDGVLRRSGMKMSIDDYKERTERLNLDGIDFDAFRDDPLSADALRVLHYMHDVEYHTVCYLRDLLVTRAHADPEITTFLTFWVFEEFWHGEALAKVLATHDEPHGEGEVGALRTRIRARDRFAPVWSAVGSALIGSSFTAVHMTWGAVNEWTTQAGYARLSQLAGHPVLTELLKRIMKQEGRHIDFYAAQATQRLTDNTKAQRATRFALKHLWSPVGASVMPDAEVEFLVRYLLGGDDGLATAQRIDRRVDRLPGLAGLNLLTNTVAAHQAGAPVSPPVRQPAAPMASLRAA
ncbi:MAG: ferritin-like domain-containing protein [Acidimicrobiales bacterium]